MHTKAWYGFVPTLTDEYDVLLWDYLGQGESSAEDVPYEIPRFCDYLAMILDGVGLERVHLMGISYGGFTAIQVCTPKLPRQPQVRAPYTCTTASGVAAGSGAKPTVSLLAVRQSCAMTARPIFPAFGPS